MAQERYHFYRDEGRRAYVLVDRLHPGIKDNGVAPPEAETVFDEDQLLAILKGARHQEWLDRLVSSSFDKEIIREHLKLINKLVDQRSE